jgi:hypothetical protein
MTTVAADMVSIITSLYNNHDVDEQYGAYLHSEYRDLCDRMRTFVQTNDKEPPQEFQNSPELLEMYEECRKHKLQDDAMVLVIRDAFRAVAGRGTKSLYDRVRDKVRLSIDHYDIPYNVRCKLLEMSSDDMQHFMNDVKSEEWADFYEGETYIPEEDDLDTWIAKYTVEGEIYDDDDDDDDDNDSAYCSQEYCSSDYEYFSS